MRGLTQTKDGNEVTISFSLAITRATLSLQLLDDRERLECRNIRMSRVAFLNSLVKRTSIQESDSATTIEKKAVSAGAKAKVKAAVDGIDGGLTGEAAASLAKENAKKSTRVKKTVYKTVNINATVGGGEAHWEITPNPAESETETGFLLGSVFRNMNSTSDIPAFEIARKDGSSLAATTITGAVYTEMSCLTVNNIKFSYDDGRELAICEIKKEIGTKRTLAEQVTFNMEAVKERLIKEVIRKHLHTQGMRLEGASVEICRAST
jgi:hypothetical protein